MAREKLTQMRLKKKRRLRGERGQNDEDGADNDEQYVVTLGSGAEEEQASDHEQSEEPIQIVPKKVKNNKRVRIAEENPENEEERVLRLLGQSGF